MTATEVESIELRSWQQVREAFRAKDMRQAGYTEGAVVMADCLLDLHGHAHRERRRLENRLFRREIFSYWENEVLGSTIRATLMPFVDAGRGDLAQIGYRSAMNLTAMIAGIDHDPADGEATEKLYAIVKKFSEGATLIHSTRDKEEVRAEVREAMARFENEQFMPSMQRRRRAHRRGGEAGERDESDLPHDVLTTLLRNEDRLDLPHEVQMREISFYLQAGAHSTANAFTHTVDDLLAWGDSHPEDLERAREDPGFVQRCMHESLRLNPASPVATRTPLADIVQLSDGTVLVEGVHGGARSHRGQPGRVGVQTVERPVRSSPRCTRGHPTLGAELRGRRPRLHRSRARRRNGDQRRGSTFRPPLRHRGDHGPHLPRSRRPRRSRGPAPARPQLRPPSLQPVPRRLRLLGVGSTAAAPTGVSIWALRCQR